MKTCDCRISTGICGSLTKGTGRLDFNGYWETPCTHDEQFSNGIGSVYQLEDYAQEIPANGN